MILQVAKIKGVDNDGHEEGEDEGYCTAQKCKHVLVDCGEDGLVLVKALDSVEFKGELQPRVCAALLLACKCMRCRKNITNSSTLISPLLKPSR